MTVYLDGHPTADLGQKVAKALFYVATTDDDFYRVAAAMANGAYTLLQTKTPDGLAHHIDFTQAGANQDTLGSVAIVGLNAAGGAVSETLALGAGLTTSVNAYATVTSITQSAWVIDGIGGVADTLKIGLGVLPTGTYAVGTALPDNAVITRGWVDVITSFTSGGAAEIALQIEGANDIVTATAVGATWNAGRHDCIPNDAAANTVKLSAANQLDVLVSVTTLLGGRMLVFLEYVVSE